MGSALAGSLHLRRSITLDRLDYSPWTREKAADEVASYFERRAARTPDAWVLVATGITDPARSRDEHDRVNYVLARNVVEGARRCGLKVATFGSIMERFVGDPGYNPYVASKIRLANFVEDLSAREGGVIHIRIHTLYGGGRPSEHMFLGQIYDAIVRKVPFEMSKGAQLREYHHVADEVSAIVQLLHSDTKGAFDLNHGQPIRLCDLATHIFAAFGCLDKLHVGARPMTRPENLDIVFSRSPVIRDIDFRDTCPAIVEYLRSFVDR
ncbi:NAD(P)-dependent oxidoreductase [Bradyrhizobium sp. 174]|nr:NAD(P)-dependent oxidoreductase [Bradyrhizobium sp. 174]